MWTRGQVLLAGAGHLDAKATKPARIKNDLTLVPVEDNPEDRFLRHLGMCDNRVAIDAAFALGKSVRDVCCGRPRHAAVPAALASAMNGHLVGLRLEPCPLSRTEELHGIDLGPCRPKRRQEQRLSAPRKIACAPVFQENRP
jgi:hypothetical protein